MFRPRRRLWGPCRPLSRVNIANIWNGSHGAKYLARITVTISSAPLTTTGPHNGGRISQFRSQQSAVVTDGGGQSEGCPVLHWPIRGTSHSPLSVMLSLLNGSWLSSPQPFATQKSFMNRNSLNQADSVQTVGRPQGDLEEGIKHSWLWKDMKLLCIHDTSFLSPSQPTQTTTTFTYWISR